MGRRVMCAALLCVGAMYAFASMLQAGAQLFSAMAFGSMLTGAVLVLKDGTE